MISVQQRLIALLPMVVFSLGCSSSVELEKPQSNSAKQSKASGKATEGSTKHDLVVQYRNDFDQAASLDEFNKTWTQLRKAHSKLDEGRWVMEISRAPPAGPGEVTMGGFATARKHFNPCLAGTNSVEITVVDFLHEEYDKKLDKPGQLVHAWSMTLGNWQGCVGDQKDKKNDRGVQLHFDLIRGEGLYVYLVRGLLANDFGRFPQDGFGRADAKGLSGKELRKLHEEAIARGGAYITRPCLALATRVYRSPEAIEGMLGRPRRYGLHLTDGAKTVYWTLDGRVMDKADISGYFSSNPKSTNDGAYLTILGVAGFQRNQWRMDDLVIRTSASKLER